MNDTILNRLLSHIQSKGIIISDVKRLNKYIVNGNYNRVMKPYLKLLEQQNFGKLEITTDDLLNLYELDKKISILFLDHLLEIEKRLNTQIAYIIEDTYRIYDGCLFSKDKEFLKHQIFSNASGSLCGVGFEQLVNKMTKYAHINPNTNTYENVSRNNLYLKWKTCPLDALCLTWTFSTTVLVYFALNDQLKKKVVKFFRLSPNKVSAFDDLINNFLSLRNLITHNNVMFVNMLDLQDQQMVSNYNDVFRAKKQFLDFYDFAILLEYFSNIPTLFEDLKRTVEMYDFSPRLKMIVNRLLMGSGGNNEQTPSQN